MAGETLKVVIGRAAGSDLPVPGSLLIGRNAAGAGGLGDDPELSRDHARVTRTHDGALVIEDLGSTNGTYLNEEILGGPAPLHPGDRVRIGDSEFTYAD
jgi:pSer/pThr/pTyr-binding forkhead associated (FHA) protein